jgi:hypothetical protein
MRGLSFLVVVPEPKKKPGREAGLFPWSADQQNMQAAYTTAESGLRFGGNAERLSGLSIPGYLGFVTIKMIRYPSPGALDFRANVSAQVTLPEWVRGWTNPHGESIAWFDT